MRRGTRYCVYQPPSHPCGVTRRLCLDLLAATATLAGFDVEVAAGQGLAPIGDQILGARQVIRPLIARHSPLGFGDHFKLAIVLDFAKGREIMTVGLLRAQGRTQILVNRMDR